MKDRPLAKITDQAEAGTLTVERAIAAARIAVKFAGNASVQISCERRKRVIMDMNLKLVDIAS